MPSIDIEVEVWCSCGEGLCNQSSAARYDTGIVVEPCEKCLETARDEGYKKGHADCEKENNL